MKTSYRYYMFVRLFFNLLGGSLWSTLDKPGFWQRVYGGRIGPGTAWRTAKQIWLDK